MVVVPRATPVTVKAAVEVVPVAKCGAAGGVTVATPGLPEVVVTLMLAGAGMERLRMKVPVPPTGTVKAVGLAVSAIGPTVTVAVSGGALRLGGSEAVMVTGPPWASAVTVKLAVVSPALMVTVAGMLITPAGPVCVRVTVMAPGLAGRLRVTVKLPVWPTLRLMLAGSRLMV